MCSIISFLLFDLQKITTLLTKLPNRNSTSPDQIPYILLKNCAYFIGPTITELFRLILDEGQIPSLWRVSNIIPVYKKGDKSLPSNYRPISLTCCLSRFFERIIVDHCTQFLLKKQFFSDEQFGFLQKRSTNLNLITTLHEIVQALSEDKQVDVIYTDMYKAFDSVPHDLLLKKLFNCGIKGKIFRFFQNFLKDRKFRVSINGTFSDSFPIHKSVPQGSVVGPFLFLIFINDVANSLPKEIRFKMFADDLKLVGIHENDTQTDILQDGLNNLLKWCNLN